jgi:heme-degrading monooxygenase HmoA
LSGAGKASSVDRDGSAVGALPRAKELVVYARTTIIQGDPAKIDDGITHVRDQVFPAVTAMDGCVGMSLLVDRGSGRCIATTAWESEAAMRASAEMVRPLRDGAERALGSSTGSDVDVWEVAVVHRDHATPDGACARVAWLSGASDTAEHAMDVFKMAVLPKLQELDGFCSASMLLNRETGRTAGTFIYDSRAQLEATREAAARLREAASRERGATVDDVAEMEVAFAHLHVPELV